MEINREDTDELTAVIKIKIAPTDYEKPLSDELEKIRKKTQLRGFRKGMVPLSLIKKQYGESVLVDQINQLINRALPSFISENKIETLAQPIPKGESKPIGDVSNPDEFQFEFEVGLAPAIDIALPTDKPVDYFRIKVDDELIEKQLTDLRRRYGKIADVESTQETDLVFAHIVELNEDNSINEKGLFLENHVIWIEQIDDLPTRQQLIDRKIDDKIIVLSEHIPNLHNEFNKLDKTRQEHPLQVQLVIKTIRRIELAELNAEFYERLYGKDSISSEQEIRERIAKDLRQFFERDAENLFLQKMYNYLLKNTQIPLPEDFLYRWMILGEKEQGKKELSEHEYEHMHHDLLQVIKWDLIQNKLLKDNNINIDGDQIIAYTQALINDQYAQQGLPPLEGTQLQQAVSNSLKNNEEQQRIYSQLLTLKVTELLKNTLPLHEQELSYEEFTALFDQEKATSHHTHDHATEREHAG